MRTWDIDGGVSSWIGNDQADRLVGQLTQPWPYIYIYHFQNCQPYRKNKEEWGRRRRDLNEVLGHLTWDLEPLPLSLIRQLSLFPLLSRWLSLYHIYRVVSLSLFLYLCCEDDINTLQTFYNFSLPCLKFLSLSAHPFTILCTVVFLLKNVI